jgi:iron complex outermembrane receptor protein
MHLFRSSSLVLLFSAALLRAQTAPAEPPPEKILHLETLFVSAGVGDKTAFDLAQGTSILAGNALLRQVRSTLGDTLASTPGVNATYYGPGASRPIIRGLGGDRVRMLTNGIGALDASNVSPDHNVAIEPLFASRIEVLRGPATLLYGSSAVGGVVNVIDNRIPAQPGDGSAHGTLEGRGGGANDERTGVAAVNAGNAHVALQVDALRQRTADIDIPGVGRIDEEAPADQPRGTLPNTASDTKSGSFGVTGFWEAGHLGASINQYETIYGVPNGEEPPVTIAMKQTRFDLNGGITQPFGPFRGATARLGYGRYRHSELDGPDVATTFNNRAWEGRLELPHAALGDVTGTVGLQSSFSDFSAVGEEVVTPPSRTANGAVFALEELKRNRITWQFGARYEYQSVRLGAVDPGLPAVPGYAASSDEKKTFGGASASLGAVYYPAPNYSLGASLAVSERLPTAQELFSNGPHGGTDAYEVGRSGLGVERSLGLDVSLRKRAGFVTGSLSGFVNRFRNYVFEQQLAGDVLPASAADGLTPYQFLARGALFYGAEAEITLHLVDRPRHRIHVTLLSDFVHAEQTTDAVPLPRMPPLRFGGRLSYEDARWSASVELRHTNRQNRFGAGETATADYTLLNASVIYLLPAGRINAQLFVRGDNLANAEARVATSFLKDLAPLPGRGVSAGMRLRF